jgi:hypothetical protein
VCQFASRVKPNQLPSRKPLSNLDKRQTFAIPRAELRLPAMAFKAWFMNCETQSKREIDFQSWTFFGGAELSFLFFWATRLSFVYERKEKMLRVRCTK